MQQGEMAVIRGLVWGEGAGGGAQSGETMENHDPESEKADVGSPVLQDNAV